MSNVTMSLPDDSQVKQVLLHYKKFYFSLGIILLCIGLIVWFIIPEFGQYTDQKMQDAQVQERIATLKSNISTLNAVNNDNQAKDLQTVMTALPQDKDYAGILYAIRLASQKSGAGVGDFTFTVGELSAKAAITKNLPYISMKLNLIGSPALIGKFLTQLSQTLPLSDVSNIELSASNATLVVFFYYKPIPQLKVNYTQPLASLKGGLGDTLKQISSWSYVEPTFDLSQSIESSSSASAFEE